MSKSDSGGKGKRPYPEPRQTPQVHFAAKAVVLAKEVDPNDPEVIKRREEEERQQRRWEEARRRAKQHRYKKRPVVFTEEDEQAYTDLLLAAFPGISIVDHDDLFDQKRLAAAAETGKPPRIRRYRSLADQSCLHFSCWMEPEGWQPVVETTDADPPLYRIANLPRLRFEFLADRGVVTNNYHNATWFREWDTPLPPIWSRDASSLEAFYHVDDEEHRQFLRKAYRLVTKIASNRLFAVDEITGRAKTAPTKSGSKTWVGNHALAWCRENPHHLLWDNYRPADEYEERRRIPIEHPDYLTPQEARDRFFAWAYKRLEEFDAELRARRKELAEEKRAHDAAKKKAAKNAAARAPKKSTAKKSTKSNKPGKKKGG